jgi:hypothetical protein
VAYARGVQAADNPLVDCTEEAWDQAGATGKTPRFTHNICNRTLVSDKVDKMCTGRCVSGARPPTESHALALCCPGLAKCYDSPTLCGPTLGRLGVDTESRCDNIPPCHSISSVRK